MKEVGIVVVPRRFTFAWQSTVEKGSVLPTRTLFLNVHQFFLPSDECFSFAMDAMVTNH